MKQKLKRAYIQGMIDLSMFLMVMGSFVYFGIYILENYL